MIEMYILQECFNFKFNDMQFGFVRGRGTNTAISQANGACYYFVNKVLRFSGIGSMYFVTLMTC